MLISARSCRSEGAPRRESGSDADADWCEDNFEGVVDLIKMKAIYWDVEAQGTKFEYRDIPAHLVKRLATCAQLLVEAAAETSEELMNKY